MRNAQKSGWGRKNPAAGGRERREHRHHDEEPRRPGRRRGGRMLDYGELRLLILAIIAERPRHGYELIKSIEERFGGSYSPSPGVLYPTLAWLDDVGYAAAETGDGNRKSYRITPEGEAFLSASRPMVEAVLARGGGCGDHSRRGAPAAVADAMDEIKSALRGVLRREGVGEAEVVRVVAILQDAARRIETEEGQEP